MGGGRAFCLVYLLWGRAVGGRANVGRDYQSSSHHGSRPSEFKPWGASHHRCNINKRQGYFGRKKNNRLIGKKPPNSAGIEEENQGRKDLVIVQSPKINLCGRWYVELLPLQSTIVGRVTPRRPHPTTFSQAESPCYYSSPA